MDLFFGIGNIAIGLMFTSIGFKYYNPLKVRMNQKKKSSGIKSLEHFLKFLE